MADEQLNFRLTADDVDASRTIDKVADKADKLEGDDVAVDITAHDEATKKLDSVDRDRKQLDGKDADVQISAQDKASKDLEQVLARVNKLDAADATVVLKAEAGKAEREIKQLQTLMGKVDGDELTFTVRARDEATARLRAIQGEIDRINPAGPTSKFGLFKQSISEAEGAMGKLRAGGTQALQALGLAGQGAALGLTAAAAAAALLVKFLKSAFTDFTDTARAARDLAAATGLTVEQASRWNAVADDVGLGADTVVAGLKGIGKTLNDTKWAEFGIATRDAGGQARDVNEIFLDTLQLLHDMPNETDRNRVGNKLLGKGYLALAPLIGQSRKEYEKWLASVEKGQVITDKESGKAEEMRKAQDNLGDSWHELTLAVGGFLVELSPLIRGLALVFKFVGGIADRLNSMSKVQSVATRGWELMGETVADAAERMQEGGKSSEEIRDKLLQLGATNDEVKDAFAELGIVIAGQKQTAEEAAQAAEELATQQREEEAAARDAAQAHRDAADAIQEQIDAHRRAVDATFALHDAEKQFADTVAAVPEKLKEAGNDLRAVRQVYEEVTTAAAGVADAQVRIAEETATATGHTLTATEKMDLWNKSLLEQSKTLDGPSKKALSDYITQVNDIPEERVSEIQAAIDNGELTKAEWLLADASRTRDAAIVADADTVDANNELNSIATKKRTVTFGVQVVPAPGTPAWIRNQFTNPGGPFGTSFVAPAAAAAAPVSQTFNVTLPTGARQADVSAALSRHSRRSGSRWGGNARRRR